MDSSKILAEKVTTCDASQSDARYTIAMPLSNAVIVLVFSLETQFMNPFYCKLLGSIHSCIQDNAFSVTANRTERNILRIGEFGTKNCSDECLFFSLRHSQLRISTVVGREFVVRIQ